MVIFAQKTSIGQKQRKHVTKNVSEDTRIPMERTNLQGLEGYFRDPGFDQNTVRDSGKRKIFWRDSGIDYIPRSGIEKNLGTGRGNSCPIVGNSGNFHRLHEHNDRESESNRRVLTGKSFLLKNKNKQLSSVTS